MKECSKKGQGVSGGVATENRVGTDGIDERNTYSSVEDIKLQLPLERNA
jgi:hypothetical protein